MIKSLVISLILTIIIEVMVSYILGIRNIKDLKIVIFVNIYTNPIVVFLSNIVYLMNNAIVYWVSVAILEVGATIIETLLYEKYIKTMISPMRLSICNNVISFSLGIIVLIMRG